MWDALGELLRMAIFSAAHLFAGSLGGGIVFVSAAIRLALLPTSLAAVRRGREQQVKVAALKPALEALQRRYARDPARLFRETRALHARHGIQLFSAGAVKTVLLQIPIFGALYSALREFGGRVHFLWIGDLARPDFLLLAIVAGLTALGMTTMPVVPGQVAMPRLVTVVAVIGTVGFLWTASSAFALSIGAGSAVTMLQNFLIAREAKCAASA